MLLPIFFFSILSLITALLQGCPLQGCPFPGQRHQKYSSYLEPEHYQSVNVAQRNRSMVLDLGPAFCNHKELHFFQPTTGTRCHRSFKGQIPFAGNAALSQGITFSQGIAFSQGMWLQLPFTSYFVSQPFSLPRLHPRVCPCNFPGSACFLSWKFFLALTGQIAPPSGLHCQPSSGHP